MTHPVCAIPSNLTCLCTFEDISISDCNYCEYRTYPSKIWHVSNYSSEIVKHLLKTNFKKYLKDVEVASKDCAAAVRRLVKQGPPVHFKDDNALPIPEGDTHIDMFWFSQDNVEVEAKLEGCLEGKEREALWNTQKQTLAAMEEAERAEKKS